MFSSIVYSKNDFFFLFKYDVSLLSAILVARVFAKGL